MVQRYLESIPLTSHSDARVLASPSGWDILEELREAGMDGLTVADLTDKLDLPTSTIYNSLRQLRAASLIKTKRYKKKVGVPTKKQRQDELRTGKKKQIFIEAIPWGNVAYVHEFGLFLNKRANDIIDNSDIGQRCSELISKIISTMKTDPVGKSMFPKRNICPNCNTDHEARELVWALLLAISDRVLDSEEMEEKCRQHDLEV